MGPCDGYQRRLERYQAFFSCMASNDIHAGCATKTVSMWRHATVGRCKSGPHLSRNHASSFFCAANASRRRLVRFADSLVKSLVCGSGRCGEGQALFFRNVVLVTCSSSSLIASSANAPRLHHFDSLHGVPVNRVKPVLKVRTKGRHIFKGHAFHARWLHWLRHRHVWVQRRRKQSIKNRLDHLVRLLANFVIANVRLDPCETREKDAQVLDNLGLCWSWQRIYRCRCFFP